MICPHCESADTRHSHRARWNDSIQARLGRRAFRCRNCRARFFVRDPSARSRHRRGPQVKVKLKFDRRLAMEACIFVVMLAMFFVFLRYLMREPMVSGAESGRWTPRAVQSSMLYPTGVG